MGTTWRVVIASCSKKESAVLRQEIVRKLEAVNKSMSLFDAESELSRFNTYTGENERFCVSDEFIALLKTAKQLYDLTDGAWDGTVGPLVNLWGFGNTEREVTLPSAFMIKDTLRYIGFNHIAFFEKNCLVKNVKGIVLDFGSIAKGFGVDAITGLLKIKGFNDFLVEIGGEVYASGTKSGRIWKVGIKTPELIKHSTTIFKAIELKNRAIATSGDYRNYREIDGEIYSHIINPLTGYPVKNRVASVSVIAGNTAFADGLATAIMVMGKSKGIQLVNTMKNVECLIITREDGGSYLTSVSNGWNHYSPYKESFLK